MPMLPEETSSQIDQLAAAAAGHNVACLRLLVAALTAESAAVEPLHVRQLLELKADKKTRKKTGKKDPPKTLDDLNLSEKEARRFDLSRLTATARGRLRRLASQLVLPAEDRPKRMKAETARRLVAWLRSIQEVLESDLTPWSDREEPAETAGPPRIEIGPSEQQAALAREALDEMRASIGLVNQIVLVGCEDAKKRGYTPWQRIALSILKKYPSDYSSADDLVGRSIVHCYDQIGAYDAESGRFLSWFSRIMANLHLSDLREKRPEWLPGESPVTEGPVSGIRFPKPPDEIESGELEELLTLPFSPDDWQTIQQWADADRSIPVVVIVGYGWHKKAIGCPEQRREFCHWTKSYGVDDTDALWQTLDSRDQLATADRFDTTDRLTVLATQSGRHFNSIRNFFWRKFAGIQQTARQNAFGKWHRAAELDIFWKLYLAGLKKVAADLMNDLRDLESSPRVGALMSGPGWCFLKGWQEWIRLSADYPFTPTVPMLEVLRNNFKIGPEHADYRPADIRSDADLQTYHRQMILAHGTKGNFAQAVESVMQARRQGLQTENQLRQIYQAAELPGMFHAAT